MRTNKDSDRAEVRGAELLKETVEAHGGAERWSRAKTVSTYVQARGLLPTWKFPGRPLDDYHYHQTVDFTEFSNVLRGFPSPELTCTFSRDEVRVESDGTVIDRRELGRARRAMQGTSGLRRVPRWDTIDSAYFLGYAMTNYLSHPYLFTRPGFRVHRGEDWRRDGQTWRRLEVEHPAGFHSHCRHETFYIDERGLIRRHEYIPDIFIEAAQGLNRLLPNLTGAANMTIRHREVDGLIFPTFRRIMLAFRGHRPVPGLTMICGQLSDISVTFRENPVTAEKPTTPTETNRPDQPVRSVRGGS